MHRSQAKQESQPTRILVVDDSAVTRAMIGRSLAISGFACEVAEAADGEEALARLRAEPFDVCFLDLNMPKVGGVEVAGSVHLDPNVTARIVIVSSESMGGRIQQLRQVGVSGYIKKPFTPEQIRDVLATLINRPNQANAA